VVARPRLAVKSKENERADYLTEQDKRMDLLETKNESMGGEMRG